jgi:hypothetical protein
MVRRLAAMPSMSAAAEALATSRQAMITCQPRWARAAAPYSPTPDDAPVMMTVGEEVMVVTIGE